MHYLYVHVPLLDSCTLHLHVHVYWSPLYSNTQVKAVLEEGMKKPHEHIKEFDKYRPVISREVHTLYLSCLCRMCKHIIVTGGSRGRAVFKRGAHISGV